MNKNQLEFAKAQLRSKNFGAVLNFLKTLATLACILACVYIIFDALKSMANSNPDGVNAIARVVEKLNIGSILSYFVAAGCAGGWALERKGKKRLLAGFARERANAEQNDSYHASSGLTESGDTPDISEI